MNAGPEGHAGPALEDHDPAFMPMYVTLAGLKPIPGFPLTKPTAHALLLQAETAYRAGDVATALGLVWDAGEALYIDAWVAAAKIQRSKVKKKTGRKDAVRPEIFKCWKDLMTKDESFRKKDTSAQADYLWKNRQAVCRKVKRETLGSYVVKFKLK